jgi:hypothetical protein
MIAQLGYSNPDALAFFVSSKSKAIHVQADLLFGVLTGAHKGDVLEYSMNKAYRFVLECPKGHSMHFERKCARESLSQSEAMEIFGNVELSCERLKCGWHGKASKARLLRILPFNWVLSPIG